MSAVEVDDKALLGALVAFRRLDKDARKAVAKSTRTTLNPLWRNIVRDYTAHPKTKGHPKQDQAMMGRGRVSATISGKVQVLSWQGRSLSGGLDNYKYLEFGVPDYPQLPPKTRPGRIAYVGFKPWMSTAMEVWFAAIADAIKETGVVTDG